MANITLSTRYDRVIAQTGISTSKYTSAMFLDDVHVITQDIWSEVVKQRRGNTNWEIWYTDTVSLQDEYKKPNVTSTTVGAEYIDTLSITYSDDTYTNTGNKQYIPCIEATDGQIADWEFYLENQPKTQPIYFQRDGSIFIAPDPRSNEVGIDRLKVTGVRSIDSGNWTLSTSEADIKLPVFFFETIVVGCVWKASIIKRLEKGDINSYKNDYLSEKQEAIYKLNNDGIFLLDFPN